MISFYPISEEAFSTIKPTFPSTEGGFELSVGFDYLYYDTFLNSPYFSVDNTVALTAAFIGGINGSLESNLETNTSIDGVVGLAGSINFDLSTDIEIVSIVGQDGTITQHIDTTCIFNGSQEVVGSFTFDLATTSAFEYRDITATFSSDFGTTTTLSGYLLPVGTFTQVITTVTNLSGSIRNLTGDVGNLIDSTLLTICMDLKSLGVSEYSNYGFNSYFKLGNNYYGCSSTGVYLLGSDKDITTDIQSTIATPATGFDSAMLKSVKDVYTTIRSSGDMRLSLKTNEQVDRTEYYVYYDGVDGLHRRRVKVAQGIKGTTWQATLSNTEGTDFTVKTLDIVPIELRRSI
jgi:hypothetical protein